MVTSAAMSPARMTTPGTSPETPPGPSTSRNISRSASDPDALRSDDVNSPARAAWPRILWTAPNGKTKVALSTSTSLKAARADFGDGCRAKITCFEGTAATELKDDGPELLAAIREERDEFRELKRYTGVAQRPY